MKQLGCSGLLLLLFGCKKDAEPEEPLIEPRVEILSPSPASWLPTGNTEILGVAEHIDALTLNGEPVEISSSSSFAASLELSPGINLLELVGTGTDGAEYLARESVLVGEFQSAGEQIAAAVEVRLNRSGIGGVIDWIEQEIDINALAAKAVAKLEPIPGDYDTLGVTAVWYEIEVEGMSFGGDLDPDLEPTADSMFIELRLPDPQVDLHLVGAVIGIGFDFTTQLLADAVVITGDVVVSTADGELVVDLLNVTAETEGFTYDASIIPWGLEQYLYMEDIQTLVEESLIEQIETLMPPLLQESLSGLDLGFETDLKGYLDLSIEPSFTSSTHDENGLHLVSSVILETTSMTSQNGLGYLSQNPVSPELNPYPHISAAISDDVLNAMLYEAWRTKFLDMTLSTLDGTLDSTLLLPVTAGDGTITTTLKLPPTVVPNGEHQQLQLGELEVLVETPGGSRGEFIRVAMTIFAQMLLEVDEEEMSLAFAEPQVSLMVRDSDWSTSSTETTTLLEGLLPVDTILALIGQLSLPIPILDGFIVADADFEYAPESNSSMLELDIVLE